MNRPPAATAANAAPAVLQAARSRGAGTCEIFVQREESRLQDGLRAPPMLQTRERWGVWLVDAVGRVAAGTGACAQEAIDAACAAPPAELDDELPPARGGVTTRRAAIGIEDPRAGMLTDLDRLDVLAGVERNLGPHRRRALRYEERRVFRSYWSSHGEQLEEAGTVFVVEAAVQLGGESLSQRVTSRRFADVASRPLGLELRRRADVAQRALPPVAGLPLAMEPRVFAGLVDAMARAFAVRPLGAPWTQPAPSGLAILDDGSLPHGLRTLGFDVRGAPPRSVPLVHAGRWGEGYVSAGEARASCRPRTGHEDLLRMAPSNLVVRPGVRTRNMLAVSLGKWLAVDSLPLGNAEDGSLRGPARFVLMDGHERLGCFVQEIDVSLEQLLRGVVELGSDEERHAHVDACTAVFAPDAFRSA